MARTRRTVRVCLVTVRHYGPNHTKICPRKTRSETRELLGFLAVLSACEWNNFRKLSKRTGSRPELSTRLSFALQLDCRIAHDQRMARRAATRRAAYRADPRTDRSPACARARSLGGALGVGESAPGRVRAALAAVTRQRGARARDFRCAAAPSHPTPRFVLISIARRRKPRSRAGSRARAGRKGWGPRGSTLTFSLSSLLARAPPRSQVRNAASAGRAGPDSLIVPRREPRGSARGACVCTWRVVNPIMAARSRI